jgi:hypothetical protein
MGMCQKILGCFYVDTQPRHGWACFAKSQFGQVIQSICCHLKRLFPFQQFSLVRDGSGLCGKASGCDQKLQLDGVLPACFRRVPAQPLDRNSPPARLQSGLFRTSNSDPAPPSRDLALEAQSHTHHEPIAAPPSSVSAAIANSPSDSHPAPHTFSGTLIPDLTLLVERFTARCPICDAAASQLCHLCGEPFCNAHLYRCSDCTLSLCGECTDVHDAEGHWGDSDTAREMFDSITGGAR